MGTYILYVVMNVLNTSTFTVFPVAITQEHETYNSCQVALEEFKKTKQQIVVGTCVRK